MSEGYNVTFVLNEYKRVGALRISDTPGGDLSPVILEIDEGGIVDVATNKIDDLTSFPVFETPDTTVPRITHAAVKLTDGTVHLTFSEIIDQTPSSDVNLDRLVFRDITASGNPGVGVPLSGATIYSSDEVYINISMTEAQRVAVIAISGTSGGNGSAVILDVAAGAVKDIAGQLIETTNAFAVEEHADVKPPNITGASLHYGRGVLTVTSDEYVDLTPISLVNTSLLRLSNISGDYTVALPYAGASTDSIEELYEKVARVLEEIKNE